MELQPRRTAMGIIVIITISIIIIIVTSIIINFISIIISFSIIIISISIYIYISSLFINFIVIIFNIKIIIDYHFVNKYKVLRCFAAELVTMIEYFDSTGLKADIDEVKRIYPELSTFKTYAQRVGLDNKQFAPPASCGCTMM